MAPARPTTSTPATSAHGYALTIHKAQGVTCDHSLVLGTDDLYREAGYVALSRGRDSNHLYAVARTPDPDAHIPEHLRRRDGIDVVTDAMKHSRAQQLAIDQRNEPDHGLGMEL